MRFIRIILSFLIRNLNRPTTPLNRTFPVLSKVVCLLVSMTYEILIPRKAREDSRCARIAKMSPTVDPKKLVLSHAFCRVARISRESIDERMLPGLPPPLIHRRGSVPGLETAEGVEYFFSQTGGGLLLRQKDSEVDGCRLVEVDLRGMFALEPEEGYCGLGCLATFEVEAGECSDSLRLRSIMRFSGAKVVEEARECVSPLTCKVLVASTMLQVAVDVRYAGLRVPANNLFWNTQRPVAGRERDILFQRDLVESTEFDVGTLHSRLSLAFGLRASGVQRYMTTCAEENEEHLGVDGVPVMWDLDRLRERTGPLRIPILSSLDAWWSDLQAVRSTEERLLIFSNIIHEAVGGEEFYSLLFEKRMVLGLTRNRFTENAPMLGSHMQACALWMPARGFPLVRDVYPEIDLEHAAGSCLPSLHPSRVFLGSGR